MSLERMVDDKVDAYRNNPGALQKNYQMNQDLLDLLALQKIKSEKDAAARQLQMSMQQNPQTIAEQLGKKSIERTKNEVVEQVGGVAKVNQARQQSNMQKVAAGAPPARQQMTGVAGQPAPNMRMQSGGIVNFAQGKLVGAGVPKALTPDEILNSVGFTGGEEAFKKADSQTQQRIIRAINARRSAMRPGVIDKAVATLVDAVQAPLIGAVNVTADALRGAGVMSPDQKAFLEGPQNRVTNMMARQASDPKRQPITREDLITFTEADLDQRDMQGAIPTPAVPASPPPPDRMPPPAPALNLSSPTMNAPTAVDRTGTTIGGPQQAFIPASYTMGIQDIRNQKQSLANMLQPRIDQSPDLQATQAGENVAKFLNRSGVAGQYVDMQQRAADLNRRLNEEARSNRFNDMTAGITSFRQVGENARRLRRRDALDQERRLGLEQEIQRSGITMDQNIGQKAVDAGISVLDIKTKDRNNAVSNQTSLFNSIGDDLSKEAKMGLDVTKANMTAAQEKAKIATQLAIANLGAKSRVAVAEYNGKIQMRGQDVQKLAAETKDRQTLLGYANQVDKLIAEVNAKIADDVNTAIEADVLSNLNMKPEERRNKIKEYTQLARKAQEATIVSLQERRRFILDRLEGGYAMPGATPSATQGFGNLRSTPPSP